SSPSASPVTRHPSPGAPLLVVRRLTRRFHEGGRVHAVLDGLDLTLEGGTCAAIIGRSGSGKSTLLNLLSGIDRTDDGTIELDGLEIGQLREPERTELR